MLYCKNNPAFDKILREMGELHDLKNEDYAAIYASYNEGKK